MPSLKIVEMITLGIKAYLGYYVASKLRFFTQAQSKGYHLGAAVI
jgi:hypothetical protein